jgi:chromosome segregation ATPase
MFKKLVVAALAVVAGLFILNSTHLGGYVRTAIQKVRVAVKRQIPIEVQLEALRHEAAQLVPDMKEQVSALATKTVAVDRLRTQVKEIQASLDNKKGELRVMKDDLKSGAKFISYHSVSYPRDVIHNKLVRDLASYTRCASELEAKKKLLRAEEEALEHAREQLESMRSAKEQVEIEIAQLEAELSAHLTGPGRRRSETRPRVLTTEELAAVRDELMTRLDELDAMREDLVELLASLRTMGEEEPAPARAPERAARRRPRPATS